MIWLLITMMNAAFSALNAVLYVEYGNPLSLGAAIFCGFMALFNMAMAGRSL